MIKNDKQLNACRINLGVVNKIIEFCGIMSAELYRCSNTVYSDELILHNAETFFRAKEKYKILQEMIDEYENKTKNFNASKNNKPA